MYRRLSTRLAVGEENASCRLASHSALPMLWFSHTHATRVAIPIPSQGRAPARVFRAGFSYSHGETVSTTERRSVSTRLGPVRVSARAVVRWPLALRSALHLVDNDEQAYNGAA